jgi:HAD superfamily hydrolase (TIGR01549 family)
MGTRALQTTLSIHNYKLFIFDLDGTLYDQRVLRLRMLWLIIFRLFGFRIGIKDLKILSNFRKQREKHKGYSSRNLEADQFNWSSSELNLPVKRIQITIEEFIYNLPLKFIRSAAYKGAGEFISNLMNNGYKVAIYSDYPADEKLAALGISADKTFCSTDKTINCLKPNKKGLINICQFFDCDITEAIFIGDRVDTDGESAKMAGIKFLKVDKSKARSGKFYKMLVQQISTK